MNTRRKFVVGGLVILATLVVLSIQGLQSSTVFFYTPEEILATPEDFQNKTIRIGALVKTGSVQWNAESIDLRFDIMETTDHSIPVTYQGVKPDMFREGQGVVVEGTFDGTTFHAQQLLVKHSEEYTIDDKAHSDKKQQYYQSLVQ